MEEEIGNDDGCDICPSGKAFFSGAKLCCRLFIIVWDFLPSSGSSFSLAFFGVEMFCLLLSVTLVSRIRLARIQGWLRGEDKTRTRTPPLASWLGRNRDKKEEQGCGQSHLCIEPTEIDKDFKGLRYVQTWVYSKTTGIRYVWSVAPYFQTSAALFFGHLSPHFF